MRKKLTGTHKLQRLPFKRKKEFVNNNCDFKYGDSGIFCGLQTRIESVYFRTLNRVLRVKYRKKKFVHIKHFFWVRYFRNLFLTKKSKNARMGSGRGALVRTAFVIKKFQSFIEFKHYDIKLVCFIRKRLYYKFNMCFLVLTTNGKYLQS